MASKHASIEDMQFRCSFKQKQLWRICIYSLHLVLEHEDKLLVSFLNYQRINNN